MTPDDPGNGPDEPISSEDLIRRAREGLSSPTPAEPEEPQESITEEMIDAAEDAADDDPASVEATYAEEPEAWEPPQPVPGDPFDAGTGAMPPPPPPVEPPSEPERPATVTDRMTTPPPQPVQTAPSPLARIWQSRGILIGLVIIGIILFRFFDNSTGVDDLSIGDCFNEPGADEFASVDVIDCSEAHDYEVLATVVLSGSDYPGDFEVTIQAFERCEERFQAYVGVPFDVSEVYIAPFVPARASWDDGQRDAVCGLYLLASDQESVARTTGSLQGSGR